MKHAIASVALIGLAALAVAQRDSFGQPIGISGVPAIGALDAPVRALTLEGRTLSLEVGTASLVITGLPDGLKGFPFSGSLVRAERRDHPDGPETRLEFRAGAKVLVIGSQTSRFSQVVTGWRFDPNPSSSTARLRLENRTALLKIGRTIKLRGADGSWCVRLMALHVPQAAQPEIALEAEGPRFDWTALQTDSAGRCTTA